MNQLPHILITGASGFTGQHACNYFLEAGYHVTAITRKNSIANKKIHTVFCNLTNENDVINLIKNSKPQYLLHLAGQNHVGQSWIDPLSSLEANTIATAYILEALRKENPTCKVVVVGSALQFDPGNMSTLNHPYSLSKTFQVIIAQSWAKLYNMHIVIAKPSNLVGPGYSNGVCSIFARKIIEMEENKSEKVLEVNNLQAQRDFIDVRDAVSAYEILLLKGASGEVYEIASGKSHSLEEIINGFRAFTSFDFEVKSKVDDQIENKVTITPSKLMKLGWKQAIPIESTLKDIVNFQRRINGIS